jgi:hypothetical protein
MATPGVYSNPDQEAAALPEFEKEALAHGHDADLPINVPISELDKSELNEESTQTISDTEQKSDPNEVGWDGDDDSHNPFNWKPSKKWFNIAILSLVTLITYDLHPITKTPTYLA